MPPRESDYNPSQGESPHFEDEESLNPSGDSTAPQAQLKILERLRRVPRSRWLLLAVIVLVSCGSPKLRSGVISTVSTKSAQ